MSQYDGPPKSYYFLLLPNLTMLAFSAAIEPLRIANQVTKTELYRWYTMSEDGAPVRCSNNVMITPDMSVQGLPKKANLFVCSGTEPDASVSQKIINWLNQQKAHGSTIGGICTGAFALAKAGFLKNRRFTLHWENQPAFLELFPDLAPTANIFENDKGLLTCGGGMAATDMMLDQIESEHGKDLALIVADMCIHSRSHHGNVQQKSSVSSVLGSRNPRLIKAVEFLHDNLEEPVEMSELAQHAGFSIRQLERLFKRYLNATPYQFYVSIRLSRAHALLAETNLSITEIAMATGFSNTSQFSRNFRRQYGVSPHEFKKSWSSGQR